MDMWMDGNGTRLEVTYSGDALLAGDLPMLALQALVTGPELLRFTYQVTDPETGETLEGAARLVIEHERSATPASPEKRVQEPEPADGCVYRGCGQPPSDHLGWNLGHTYRSPGGWMTKAQRIADGLTNQQAEEQPHGADATARSLARQMAAYGAASAALAETIANPPEERHK